MATPEQKAREALGANETTPPCDCINNKLGSWIVDGCYCRNTGDTEQAADWCARENSVERVAALLQHAALSEFHNALRIMINIDKPDFTKAIAPDVWPDSDSLNRMWLRFRDDPYRWFIRADDEHANAIYRVVTDRQA